MVEHASLYTGICKEARAALLFSLVTKSEGSSVILTADPRRAREIAAEMGTYKEWTEAESALLLFPEDPPPDIDARRRNDRIGDRLAVLSSLLSGKPFTLVATPEALLGKCPARDRFENQQIKLAVGQEVNFQELIDQLSGEFDYDSKHSASTQANSLRAAD